MSKISIKKCKILSGTTEIDYNQLESTEAEPVEVKATQKNLPHKDFVKAMGMMDVHAALILEMVAIKSVKDIKAPDLKLFKDFHVTGLSMVGKDDDEGVILTVTKTLSTGKTFGANTPTTRFNDEGDNAYPFLKELKAAVKKVHDQAVKYLGGHYAPDPQGDLFHKEEEAK